LPQKIFFVILILEKDKIMLSKTKKKEIIEKLRLKDGDTGSPEVQIALLTERINALTEHFKLHKKDNNSKKGLLGLIGRRRKLLRYLSKCSPERYREVLTKLGLRK